MAPSPMLSRIAAVGAAGLILAACDRSATVNSNPAASSGTASLAQPAPSGVTITITSPKDGSTVPADSMTVTYEVTGVNLVAGSQAQKLDDYHAHVLLDVNPVPYLSDFQPFPMGNDYIVHTAAKTVTFSGVSAGSHTLNVSLATSNHLSVKPPISATATFTVQ